MAFVALSVLGMPFVVQGASSGYYDVFLSVNENVDLTQLRNAGLVITARYDGIITAEVPNDMQPSSLKSFSGVLNASRAIPILTYCDSVRYFSRVDPVHRGERFDKPYDGSGVIVGVIDCGFDFNHINLCDENGNTRVKAVYLPYDNTGKTVMVNRIPLPGTCFETLEKIKALTTDDPKTTHGTQTAGIAAGSYTGNGWYGIATGADIVACGMPETELSDVKLAHCISYIDDYARRVGKPYVVNISMGNNVGAHDGSSFLSTIIQQFAGPGKVFVVSAGNDGDQPVCIHESLTAKTDTITALMSGYAKTGGLKRSGCVNAWSRGAKPFNSRIVVVDTRNGNIVYKSRSLGTTTTGVTAHFDTETDEQLAQYYTGSVDFSGTIEANGNGSSLITLDMKDKTGYHAIGVQYYSPGALATEPKFGLGSQPLDYHLVPVQVVFLRSLVFRWLIAEFDSPLIVIVYTRIEAGLGDVVLRLSHIIEAGVVHDADGMSMLLHPGFVAEFLHRGLAAGAHIVTQAEGMADLVRRDEADEVTHQFVVILDLAGARIDDTGLDLIPVVNQGHDIVVPADVALDDLTGARIVHIGTVGICRRRSQVTDHGETGILEAHVWIVLRPFLCMDGILPSGLLESLLPVVDAGDKVGTPLLRSSGIDVIDDGLYRLDKLSPLLFLDILRTGLEAPAGDETHGLDSLLFIRELAVAVGEITNARIEQALLHGNFREKHHRSVEHHGHDTGPDSGGQGACDLRPTGAAGIGGIICKRLGYCNFRIDGICTDAVDEAGIATDIAKVVRTLGAAVHREYLIVTFEEACHLDTRSSLTRGGFRFDRGNNRVFGTNVHSLFNIVSGLCRNIQYIRPEQEIAVDGLLPIDHGFSDFLSAVLTCAGRIADEAGHSQNPTAKQAVRNLEIPVLLVLGNAEEALLECELRLLLLLLLRRLLGVLAGSRLTGSRALCASGHAKGEKQGGSNIKYSFHGS